MKKRISTALATLLLLAVSLPALVIAQQSGGIPPGVPGAGRGTPSSLRLKNLIAISCFGRPSRPS